MWLKKSGLGKSRKSVNKLLYHLEKKKVLTVTTSNGRDPKWNKNPVAQYSGKDLHDWSAELEYGNTFIVSPTPDDVVPTEIKLMADKRSIALYLKLLESGSEKKRDIRLVIVGKKGAGKTSLIKRLFSEEITDVTSTNGIKIYTIKCKAMTNDGIWKKLDGSDDETEIHARLLKQYKGTIEASVEEGAHKPAKDNPPSTSFDESRDSNPSA
ncbi:unnamed protein product [Mytilus edulis]|uniref:Uncharacterized protein n=1 Tax=Mytilus edulis TaxID=6550 RepID=A0A8S3SWQ0_MYTED|nr:unnamed protein product [Mytilus edulis]